MLFTNDGPKSVQMLQLHLTSDRRARERVGCVEQKLRATPILACVAGGKGARLWGILATSGDYTGPSRLAKTGTGTNAKAPMLEKNRILASGGV